jgi:leucyl/phenylalanyl-tRNA---protein transferase
MSASRYSDWESVEFPVGPDAAGTDRPIAFCADLSPGSVLAAYRRGIFPMPAPGDYWRDLNEIRYEDQVAAGTIAIVGDDQADPYQVAWWSPDPRPVIAARGVHLGRNVRKRLRHDGLTTTANVAFGQVAEACRAGREPRWLTDTLLATLTALHDEGWAHSIEVWLAGDLVGGAIGVAVGTVISGDSLFGRHPGAAAAAVADMAARLAEAGGVLIDAQWDSPFLRSLGAVPLPRDRYLVLLGEGQRPVRLPAGPRPAVRLLAPAARLSSLLSPAARMAVSGRSLVLRCQLRYGQPGRGDSMPLTGTFLLERREVAGGPCDAKQRHELDQAGPRTRVRRD